MDRRKKVGRGLPKLVITSLALCLSTWELAVAQQVVINELMSANSVTICNEDGDYPDWIELFNPGNESCDLTGYGLSDSKKNLSKWQFPALAIPPHQFLLIFASGKDRRLLISHWEKVITKGDQWRYRVGSSTLPSNWMQPEFNDESWQIGASGFGYGDNDDATLVPPGTISIFIRKHFSITDLSKITSAVLHVDFDDGFVAYLNGIEIARANLGTPGRPVAYNQYASDHEAGTPIQYIIANWQTILRAGDNVLALQGHNSSSTSSDLSLIPYLSLGMTEKPANSRGSAPFSDLPLAFLHTNFKIDADGETITLTKPDKTIIDQVESGNIPTDVSCGRQPDGSVNFYFFAQPTPGAANTSAGYLAATADPEFSLKGGFYQTAITLSLSTNSNNAAIYYTLDGSEPTTKSNLYTQPITISSTKVVRAKAFGANLLPSKTVTHTYFINKSHQVPVLSIVTSPGNFFDIDTGIYVLGRTYENQNPYFGANFWEDWERPVHLEFFELGGKLGFSQDAGVKIAGAWSRANPQKPFSLYARRKYGASSFKYPLFPHRPFDEYEAFMLKNGGNDWGRTFFSDAMMHSLLEGQDLEIMAFRPCVVYLNGEYWGIYNLREKQNEHYLSQYFRVDPDSVDLLENNQNVICGSGSHYAALINFIETNNLEQSETYEYVKTQLDVDNFITYMVAEIYFDNRDWPGNNIKYWRPQNPTGRWRWLLFDVDWGFGLNAYDPGGGYDYNTLAFATAVNGPDWPNPPWSTLLLRKLLTNRTFRDAFINRFADYLNTIFQPAVVLEKIREIQAWYEPEIPAMIQKWGRTYPEWGGTNCIWYTSINDWKSFVQVLANFGKNRIPYMQAHITSQFGLSGIAFLQINVSPAKSGQVKVNTVTVPHYPWQGSYFKGVPITIRSIAGQQYEFDHWEGLNNSFSPTIELSLSANGALTAVFRLKASNSYPVVINEINYNSSSRFNPGDWIELCNLGESSIDLTNWQLNDCDGIFKFPAIELPAKGFLVIVQDSAQFKTHFPRVTNLIGNLPYGLNSVRETILLKNPNGLTVDSVTYQSRYPFPLLPDGGGPALALKDPSLDNTQAANWIASAAFGSPGVPNDSMVTVTMNPKANLPSQIRLLPNYPNPFNATTTLRFELPQSQAVSLLIYNLRGQLVDRIHVPSGKAGYQEIVWSPSQLSAGVYLYQLRSGSVVLTGKCLLIK
jgi:hypothetical protein